MCLFESFHTSLPKNTCVSLDNSQHFCFNTCLEKCGFVPMLDSSQDLFAALELGPKALSHRTGWVEPMCSSPNPHLSSYRGWTKQDWCEVTSCGTNAADAGLFESSCFLGPATGHDEASSQENSHSTTFNDPPGTNLCCCNKIFAHFTLHQPLVSCS